MQKAICQRIINKELLYSIPGYVYFLYLLFPFRFWESFVFPNQTETVVISVYFVCILLLFFSLKAYKTVAFQFNKIDLFLALYGIYLLCRLRYPVEKEYLFQTFSIVGIYLYFRNLTEDQSKGLLFLLPIAGIIQIADGQNHFTMPWQNLSHIIGIFQNTGLFGGFVALGFVVCIGILFYWYPDKRHIQSMALIVLAFILAKQIIASGSRASWLATLGAILFLLFRFVPRWKIHLKNRWLKYFLATSLLVLFVFFPKYLYELKKDSAEGRLLIARVSMKMIKEAPVFGSGISGFRAEYLNYQADYFQTHLGSTWANLADDVESPYNEFLKILIEQGIIGLALFFCLLYYLFEKETLEKRRRYILQSVVLSILIFGLFSYPLDKLPFVALFVFSIAGLSINRNPVFTIHLQQKNYFRIPLLFASCLVSLIIAGNAYCYAKSCLAWNHAFTGFGHSKEKSILQLKNLFPDLENNPVFLTTYGRLLSFDGYCREAVVVLEKAVKLQPLSFSYIELGKNYEAEGFPEKALDCWKRAELMVPSRFTPQYLTMKLYFKNKKYDVAREYAERLLMKKIKIDNPEIGLMKREARDILNVHPPPE